MKHTVKIIFGKEQVNKFISNISFTEDELQINLKEFSFNSEIELVAFTKGINEGIGWVECYLVEGALCEG